MICTASDLDASFGERSRTDHEGGTGFGEDMLSSSSISSPYVFVLSMTPEGGGGDSGGGVSGWCPVLVADPCGVVAHGGDIGGDGVAGAS